MSKAFNVLKVLQNHGLFVSWNLEEIRTPQGSRGYKGYRIGTGYHWVLTGGSIDAWGFNQRFSDHWDFIKTWGVLCNRKNCKCKGDSK